MAGHGAVMRDCPTPADGDRITSRRIPTTELIVFLLLVAGCRPKPGIARGDWFVRSYDRGVLTATHDGNIYTATCDTSRSFNNASSVTDERNVVVFPSCDLAIALVGSSVQPLEGKQRGRDGSITVMWSVGATLAIRSWRDERTPWRQEEFRITSVVAQR